MSALDGHVVGVVGLGNMGTPMSANLVAAGATVRAFDVSAEARERFAAAVPEAEIAGSAAETAAGAEAVLLILPNSDIVESVTGGALADALEPGAVLVDMSSSEPTRTVALAERLAAEGRTFIDAPVSGGVSGARAATLAVMAGGAEEAVAKVWPLFEAIGRPRHVGAVGAGHALKALNNLMSAASLLASSEAMLVGMEFGLDPEIMLDVVNASSGRSWSTEHKWPNFILPGTYGDGFGIDLMVKDLRIALGLAESTGGPARHAAATLALWDEAAAALPKGAGHTEIARYLRGEY